MTATATATKSARVADPTAPTTSARAGVALTRVNTPTSAVRLPDMLRATLTQASTGLRVRVWQSEGTNHPNQDRWLASDQPTGAGHTFRVAAIDGVTPWRALATPGGDAAQAAAATVAGTLLLPVTAREALLLANRALHDPAVSPSRCQSMAAVAVADCYPDPAGVRAEILVAADCEVWAVDPAGALTLVAGGEFLAPQVAAACAEQRANPAPGVDVRAAVAEIIDDPATQVRHAVGRYPAPVWQSATVTAAAFVVASDGCALREWAAAGAPTLGTLPVWLEKVTARGRRDDLTCLLVDRT